MCESGIRTPLHDKHMEFGGHMVEFAGWLLPLHFAGITEEHLHTRSACSVFDVSHMGRLSVSGRDAQRLLDYVCTRNLADAKVGRSYYSHICREDGGILDDVIVSRFEEDWGIVCNGANREKIVAWLNDCGRGFDAVVRDDTLSTAMLAVQGPKTMEVVDQIAGRNLSTLSRYGFTTYELMGTRIVVYRSGYTGEDGVEVAVPAGAARILLPYLMGTKQEPHRIVKPAGLGARDTLRIEAAMPLYGHELSERVDSFSARQEWCVDLSKDFIGAEALRRIEATGLRRRLVGLELDGRRIARQYYAVFAGDTQVGEVTSGTLSPTLRKSLAMAFVSTEYTEEGTELEVDVRGKRTPARVVKLPFYKREKA
ncbi:MAG: glycine cleavage system aminomethyltransferase GcvT [Phycisphaerae bacterium]